MYFHCKHTNSSNTFSNNTLSFKHYDTTGYTAEHHHHIIKQTHCLLSKHWVHLVVRHNHFSIKGSVMSMVHTQPHTREEVAML